MDKLVGHPMSPLVLLVKFTNVDAAISLRLRAMPLPTAGLMQRNLVQKMPQSLG